jgi:hypothetical protein
MEHIDGVEVSVSDSDEHIPERVHGTVLSTYFNLAWGNETTTPSTKQTNSQDGTI